MQARITISLILISLPAGFLLIGDVNANFYMPPANTVWTIEYPQNSTYGTNFFELRFRVETNLGLLYFYSLDGQPKKEINTTTLSSVPLPEYTPFIDGTLWNRRIHQGTVELPYLQKGQHALAIYQIYPLSPEQPENGNIVSQALIVFTVTSSLPESPLPSATFSATPSNPSASPSTSPTMTISLSPLLSITPNQSIAPSTSLSPEFSPTQPEISIAFSSPKPQPTPSPTLSSNASNSSLAAIITGSVVAAVLAGLLVYFASNRGLKK